MYALFAFTTIIAVVAAIVAEPYMVNRLAQPAIEQQLQHITQQIGLQTVSIDYQRNYSDATITSTHKLQQSDSDATIVLNHVVSTWPQFSDTIQCSGLNLLAVTTTLAEENFTAEQQATIRSVFNNLPPVTVSTRVAIDGSECYQLTIPPANYSEDGSEISFSGLRGDVAVSSDKRHATGKFAIDTIQGSDSEASYSLSKVAVSLDQKRNNLNLWIGTANSTIASIQVGTMLGGITLQNIDFSYQLEDQTETLNYLSSFTVDQIVTPPLLPVEVTALSYTSNLHHLDSVAIVELAQIMETMQQQSSEARTAEDLQQLEQQWGELVIPVAETILHHDPVLQQKLTIPTSEGVIDADLRLTIQGLPEDFSISNSESAMDLFPYLQATANAKVPMSILQFTPMAEDLALYIDQGLLVVEGGLVVVQAELRNGELLLNNTPIELPAM